MVKYFTKTGNPILRLIKSYSVEEQKVAVMLGQNINSHVFVHFCWKRTETRLFKMHKKKTLSTVYFCLFKRAIVGMVGKVNKAKSLKMGNFDQHFASSYDPTKTLLLSHFTFCFIFCCKFHDRLLRCKKVPCLGNDTERMTSAWWNDFDWE